MIHQYNYGIYQVPLTVVRVFILKMTVFCVCVRLSAEKQSSFFRKFEIDFFSKSFSHKTFCFIESSKNQKKEFFYKKGHVSNNVLFRPKKGEPNFFILRISVHHRSSLVMYTSPSLIFFTAEVPVRIEKTTSVFI